MESMKQENVDLYNKNKDAQVISPNPATTASAVSGNTALPRVDSYFVQNYLGPNGTADTMVNAIDTALRKTQIVNIIS